MTSRIGPKKRYSAVAGENDSTISDHSGSSSGRMARMCTFSPSIGTSQWYLLGYMEIIRCEPGEA